MQDNDHLRKNSRKTHRKLNSKTNKRHVSLQRCWRHYVSRTSPERTTRAPWQENNYPVPVQSTNGTPNPTTNQHTRDGKDRNRYRWERTGVTGRNRDLVAQRDRSLPFQHDQKRLAYRPQETNHVYIQSQEQLYSSRKLASTEQNPHLLLLNRSSRPHKSPTMWWTYQANHLSGQVTQKKTTTRTRSFLLFLLDLPRGRCNPTKSIKREIK